MSVLSDFRELVQRRSIVRHFFIADLKTGHRDKVLGNIWQLVDPLAFMLVYYVVWSIVLGRRGPDRTVYLLSGIITFRVFSDMVLAASNSLRSHARLIREVYFPKASLPTAVALSRLHDFAWALAALFLLQLYAIHVQGRAADSGIVITHPVSLGIHILWLPAAVGLLFAFSLGCSYLSAIGGVLFRDTPNILSFLLRIWFYLSPLFYYEEDVPRNIFTFYRVNPFTHFFRLIRNAMLYDRPPTLNGTVYVACLSIVVLIIGFVVFSKFEGAAVKQL
jgi:ABC-type polysaccharide/polyol phosphate export permease